MVDSSRLPRRGADARARRPTREVERATLIGAVAAGVPAWIVAAALLRRHSDTLPPDEFERLAYGVELLAIVVLAAVAGAVAAGAVSIARSADEGLCRPMVVFWMSVFTLPVMLVLAPFGFLILTVGGHRAIGFVGVAGVALGFRWGARLGYHAVAHDVAAALVTGRPPRGAPPG